MAERRDRPTVLAFIIVAFLACPAFSENFTASFFPVGNFGYFDKGVQLKILHYAENQEGTYYSCETPNGSSRGKHWINAKIGKGELGLLMSDLNLSEKDFSANYLVPPITPESENAKGNYCGTEGRKVRLSDPDLYGLGAGKAEVCVSNRGRWIKAVLLRVPEFFVHPGSHESFLGKEELAKIEEGRREALKGIERQTNFIAENEKYLTPKAKKLVLADIKEIRRCESELGRLLWAN